MLKRKREKIFIRILKVVHRSLSLVFRRCICRCVCYGLRPTEGSAILRRRLCNASPKPVQAVHCPTDGSAGSAMLRRRQTVQVVHCATEGSALPALRNRRQYTAQPTAVQCFAEARAGSALRNRRQCTAQPKAMHAVHRPIRGSAVQKQKAVHCTHQRQCNLHTLGSAQKTFVETYQHGIYF